MKAWPGPLLSNLATSVAGVCLALLLSEIGVRLFWSNAPPSVAPADTLPLEQVRDPEVLYRLIPGATGHFNGTEIHVNAMGLRDRDYPIPPAPGTGRIFVLGDSMVFGVGLRPEETLPGQLARLLSPVEVINGGVFGYNLTQEISLLRDVGLKYRPDLVVSCFVHNDIDNWGLGDGGAVPEIKSSRFEPPPRDNWSARLADLMLPDTFDPDRLNLLPRSAERPGLRPRLASMSRLYLFVYLRLRTHAWSFTSGERRDPLVASPACQSEEVIWRPLREKYRTMKRLVERSGARLVVVIQGGLLWKGRPLVRLRELMAAESIPCLDLTPVWRDADFYAREYSLGWDPHPNRRANAMAAELVAAYLEQAGLVPGRVEASARRAGPPPGPHDVIAANDRLRERLAAWDRDEALQIERDDAAWNAASSGFSSSVEFDGSGARVASREQILYGFWEADEARLPPPAPGPEPGWWMSSSAAVLLRPAAGARRVTIDLVLPRIGPARERTPPSVHLTLGAPPDRCDASVFDLSVDPGGEGSFRRVQAELPATLLGAGTVEVDLSVDRPFLASYLDARRRDPRLVSFMIRRIALE